MAEENVSTEKVEGDDSQSTQSKVEHPWPYLAPLFAFCSASNNTYRFKCLLCSPKEVECSAYRNSPSNLKKHVERMHPSQLDQYEQLAAAARKRKAVQQTVSGSDSTLTKKLKQQQITGIIHNANMVTQAAIDSAVINLVVGALLPIRIIEVAEFKDLIATLQPNRTVISRRTLRRRISEQAQDKKQKLIELLKLQSHVTTTTDCWSAYGKSYIGVTIHWIDSSTLQRKSACLALRRRMTGRHTFDVIAATLDDIHAEYGIWKKIVPTTTDNGANFIKAFSVFATGG